MPKKGPWAPMRRRAGLVGRRSRWVVVALPTLVVAVCVVRLWGGGLGPPGGLAGDVSAQLARLDAAIAGGAAVDAQARFPEGFAFTHLLVALAGVDAALQEPSVAPRAVARGRSALAALESAAGRAPFPDLPPDGAGAFHASWTAYLSAGITLVQGEGADPRDTADLRRRCDAFADLLRTSPGPFPPSYVGQAWPVDVLPGLVALRVCDRRGLGDHVGVVDAATDAIRTTLDPELGLLPHRTDPRTGATVEGPRATSSSLAQRFLVDVDPDLAARTWAAYRQAFVSTRLSLPLVLEHPDGRWWGGDVDSGPLVAGASLSATVVTMGAARVMGDQHLADQIHHAGEAFGLPVRVAGRSTYGLGLLPLGEAFVVWSKTATPWLADVAHVARPPVVPAWWRVPWSLAGGLVAVLGAWFVATGRLPRPGRRHGRAPDVTAASRRRRRAGARDPAPPAR